MASLTNAEIKLSQYCNILEKMLDTANYQQKRDILDMLTIKSNGQT
jgi:hypothetical protein